MVAGNGIMGTYCETTQSNSEILSMHNNGVFLKYMFIIKLIIIYYIQFITTIVKSVCK